MGTYLFWYFMCIFSQSISSSSSLQSLYPGGVRHDPQRVLGKNVEIAHLPLARPSEHFSRLTVKSNWHPNVASFSESCH